jgi:hypothetical protein
VIGLPFWVGVESVLLVAALVLAVATPGINHDQADGTAWRVKLGRLTLDLSPWTLDVPLRYRPKSVKAVLDGWGPIGLRLSIWFHLTLDVVFPLAYAVSLSLAIRLAAAPLHLNGAVLALIVWMPYATALADWVENAAIVILSRWSSFRTPGLASTLWIASVAKWLLLISSICALVICWDADLNPVLKAWGVPAVELAPWQGFYTATAGGSAAILGLFYVAQSVQGQTPTRAEHQAGRQHVALTSTFTTVMILLISLSALWAHQSARAFGAVSIVLMLAYAVLSLWHQRYVGRNLRFQRWRRWRVVGAIIALSIVTLGGVGAVEESRTGLPLIATGLMISFGLWAITALALLYPQPEASPRVPRAR